MDLYNSQRQGGGGGAMPSAGLNLGGLTSKPAHSPRMQLYAEVLSHLRRVMISKMAKPEEVLIVEDDNGEIVREALKDTDSITLYKNMRECLIYLTNLDTQDTQEIMLAKLTKQVCWQRRTALCRRAGGTERDELNACDVCLCCAPDGRH